MIYEQHKNKIHQVIFVLCILAFIVSPPYNQGVAWSKETKTTSGSVANWMVETVQNNWKADTKKHKPILIETNRHDWIVWKTSSWGKGKTECNQECKINTLIWLGIREEIASSLVMNCKAIADDPRKCVIVWASVVTSESSWWWNCRKNNEYNCFWIMQNNNYTSYNDATLHFAWKFQKWWRNAKSMEFFYPKRWWVSPSRFCTSEHSSNSSVWCENWLKNSSFIFNKLQKLF